MGYINPRYLPKDKTSELEKRQNAFKAQLLGLRQPPGETSSYRRRAAETLMGGQQATNYESMKRNQREQAKLEALRKRMQAQSSRLYNVSVGQGQGPSLTPTAYNGYTGNMPSGTFGKFINAISNRESGGTYHARNPSSGALGKYQIMPGNIRGWSKEALGRSISPSQFYNSPQLQEQIAQYKLRQYYNKYGPWGAAVAWYAGPGALKYGTASLQRRQGAYSSIATYANAILRRMGL